jgi:23S rRNA (uracil1939-C5)-methyltransferase
MDQHETKRRAAASPPERGQVAHGGGAAMAAGRRQPRQAGRKSKPDRSRSAPPADPVTVRVARLGARGDGIAPTPDGPLYIANAAPGDVVRARPTVARGDGRSAALVEIVEPGPERAEPVCRHAAVCGGCALQHLSAAAQADFKRGAVIAALARKGFDADRVTPLVSVPPGTRRRVRFAARRRRGGTVLGFNERAADRIVDLAECPVSAPRIAGLIAPLRTLIGALPSFGAGGDVQIALSNTGADLLLIPDAEADPGLEERAALAEFADAHDIARIAWQRDGTAEPVAARRTPSALVGGRAVALPMGGFLQPSAEGAALLTQLVLDAVPDDADPVADFYCGIGTFALPLAARGAAVHAAESEAEAVAALRRAGAGLRLTAERRDLARDPPNAGALNKFAAAVFDPPRAGAAALAERLAQSAIPRIVAVSCNPATLARDLRTLTEGGYRLERVTPVDQFPWSAHVEAVAILSRPGGPNA